MFRSLHMKLVLILLLLILSLMAVVGSFLISSVVRFYMEEFSTQMASAFDDSSDFVSALRRAADEEDAGRRLEEVIDAHAALLGVDDNNRKSYILDGGTGAYAGGADKLGGQSLTLTPNILTALSGEPGYSLSGIERFFDCAVPIVRQDGGRAEYVVYIRDNRESLNQLTNELFTIVVEAVLFGLIISVLLSLLLSKTMTAPIEQLTQSAKRVAAGDFSKTLGVHSSDEIGTLTRTFNKMAGVLKETIDTVGSERDKLGTLFLHMTDGVAAFDRNGAVMHVNPAAIHLLGIHPGAEDGFDALFGNIVPFEEVLKLRPPDNVEYPVTADDKYLQVVFAPFGAEAGEGGLMAVIHDITEQMRLDEVRREFVSNVSHELRTPLTNVKSYAETLVYTDDLPIETAKSFGQVIVNEADRMTRLVRDLLTLSRLDYGKMEWSVGEFSLEHSLKNIYEAMSIETAKHRHECTLEIAGGMPMIWGDRERIEQVIVNIYANAMTYTPDGGKISVTAGFDTESVWVRIQDSGIGIPKEDLPRLFERFYRVDKARSRSLGGTGLGLAIASEIVHMHNGKLGVDSKVGEGTAVTLTLPVGSNRPEEAS